MPQKKFPSNQAWYSMRLTSWTASKGFTKTSVTRKPTFQEELEHQAAGDQDCFILYWNNTTESSTKNHANWNGRLVHTTCARSMAVATYQINKSQVEEMTGEAVNRSIWMQTVFALQGSPATSRSDVNVKVVPGSKPELYKLPPEHQLDLIMGQLSHFQRKKMFSRSKDFGKVVLVKNWSPNSSLLAPSGKIVSI